jgi:hypothetical protein
MIELAGNIWDLAQTPWPGAATYIGITTNGYVKKNGEAVMGRGVALQAKQRYPGLPEELGREITLRGNRVFFWHSKHLFNFPVKVTWDQPAKLDLIAESAATLATCARANGQIRFLLPRPGCGNGGLKWVAVKPLLIGLPDNVVIVSLPGEK